MTTTPTTLTPAQFLAARALAQAYHHLWGGVPDGTYEIEAIQEWSEQYNSDQFPGIDAPTLVQHPDQYRDAEVRHVTGTGRLRWSVGSHGFVRLEIYRPFDPSRLNASEARTFAYASMQPVRPPEESGVLVAVIDIENGCEDKWGGPRKDAFSVGNVSIYRAIGRRRRVLRCQCVEVLRAAHQERLCDWRAG